MKTSRTQEGRQYWLVKTEPDVFSISDWQKIANLTTHWEGVRNFQARNFLRDGFQLGDRVLVYHSNAEPPGIVGIAEVSRTAYPDAAAIDKKSDYSDERAIKTGNNPWVVVDLKLTHVFSMLIDRDKLRAEKKLSKMGVLAKGSRLSVQPVTREEFECVLTLSEVKLATRK